MNEFELLEKALAEKRYWGYALAEPTLERLRGVCELLGVKSIEGLGRSLDIELLLTTRFGGDEAKVQRFLKLCLSDVQSPIENTTGALLLEVEQDFFMRYALTSGLLQSSLAKLSEQAEQFQKATETLTAKMKKVKKSTPPKAKRKVSSRK